MSAVIHEGDCLETLSSLPNASVQTCVTSPPYYGLRDYGHAGQIGLEETPGEYVARLVEVFREVRRVLRDDGTLWLNLGDTYAGARRGSEGERSTLSGSRANQNQTRKAQQATESRRRDRAAVPRSDSRLVDVKPKDLLGIPWMVAFALRADGWYLRQDIIWQKPNPMPESVGDRCTKSHEYVFLLSKSRRYYFDQDAIAEPLAETSIDRLSRPNLANEAGSQRVPGKTNGPMKAVAKRSGNKQRKDGSARGCPASSGSNVCGSIPWEGVKRNKRSVWSVSTRPFKGAHFAVFPEELVRPCVLAGAPEGGVVLDPFAGSGTTGVVSIQERRGFVGCELNPEYADMARARLDEASAVEDCLRVQLTLGAGVGE